MFATVAGELLRRLDTSVGAPGPYDFAVRLKRFRQKALSASTASRPAFVTFARAPLCGDGTVSDILLIWVCGEAEYFCKWGWTLGAINCPGDLPVGQRFAGWVERFAKPIAIVQIVMGIAEFIIGRAFARPVGPPILRAA